MTTRSMAEALGVEARIVQRILNGSTRTSTLVAQRIGVALAGDPSKYIVIHHPSRGHCTTNHGTSSLVAKWYESIPPQQREDAVRRLGIKRSVVENVIACDGVKVPICSLAILASTIGVDVMALGTPI